MDEAVPIGYPYSIGSDDDAKMEGNLCLLENRLESYNFELCYFRQNIKIKCLQINFVFSFNFCFY